MALRTISPEGAGTMLQAAWPSRRVNFAAVARRAQAMKDGSWKPAGDPVSLDEDGRLRAGQHVLHAIIMAGVPVKVKVES